jgi:hypothetical protein
VPLCSGVMTIVGIVPTTRGRLTISAWTHGGGGCGQYPAQPMAHPSLVGAMGAGGATGLAAGGNA